MLNGDSLEGRVLVISDSDVFSDIQRFSGERMEGLYERSDSLDNHMINSFDAVVLTAKEHLAHASIQKNFLTPVVYFSDDDALIAALDATPANFDEKRNEFLNKYNLFTTTDGLRIPTSIKEALDAKKRVKIYLSNHPKGLSVLSRQNPPKFRNALAVADEYETIIETLNQWSRMRSAKEAVWPVIRSEMLRYHATGEDFVARGVAPLVSYFLTQIDHFVREKSVFPLGGGESGEDRVSLVKPSYREVDMQYEICREISARGNLSAKMIAEQRYRDAKHMSQLKNWHTAHILKPLHLANYPDPRLHSSFLVMQYIAGPPLYKLLLTLNDAASEKKCDENKKAKINLLRRTLIEKYIDDTAVWVNESVPSFVQKPSPEGLITYYQDRIRDVPAAFSKRTTSKFSELESKLWKEAIKVVSAIRVDEKHIVRNRDTSLANAVIHIPDFPKAGLPVDDYLNIFGVTSREKIDESEVNERFFNIDMQYRYGHVLEDLAQILTFYEASFLLRGKDNKFTPHPPNISKMRDRFLANLSNQDVAKDLKNDETSFYAMLLYRAVRKMYLFTDYWERTCVERENRYISNEHFRERRARFTENIEHHYLLGQALCIRVSLELSKQLRGNKEYLKTVEMVDAARRDVSAKQYEKVLEFLQNPAHPPVAVNYVRAQVMRELLDKIEDDFTSTSGLKYCGPTPRGGHE